MHNILHPSPIQDPWRFEKTANHRIAAIQHIIFDITSKKNRNHVKSSQCPHMRHRRDCPLHPRHPIRHRVFHLLQNYDVAHGHKRHF